jgi:hypothetical protein
VRIPIRLVMVRLRLALGVTKKREDGVYHVEVWPAQVQPARIRQAPVKEC